MGSPNVVNNDLIYELKRQYDVIFFNDNVNEMGEILREKRPELILISLVDHRHSFQKIFSYIRFHHSTIPVLVLGKSDEHSQYEKYYNEAQFDKIVSPFSDQDVLKRCHEIIYLPESTTKQRHILVVDDNAVVLRNIKALLSDNYTVAVAVSGAQAFISIGKRRPDLILLDYDMPVMNGKMVLENLRADEELADIPTVFLTSVADEELVTELLQMKPAGYVLKPPDKELLLEKISAVLEG